MDSAGFVDRIDNLLSERGLNRAKLLRETELAESTIRSWRRGVLPNVEYVYRVAQFLDTSIEFLLTGEGIEKANNKPIIIVKEPEKPFLKENEEELLNLFKSLSPSDQKLIIALEKRFSENKQDCDQ